MSEWSLTETTVTVTYRFMVRHRKDGLLQAIERLHSLPISTVGEDFDAWRSGAPFVEVEGGERVPVGG
ncbi:MAG: hypothetical protein MUE59_17265, partial [Thiobacillaceae bacterium]|jgi:hypothetical protein|nr:hypothetical protein [Thiobacillaceae bacterium]